MSQFIPFPIHTMQFFQLTLKLSIIYILFLELVSFHNALHKKKKLNTICSSMYVTCLVCLNLSDFFYSNSTNKNYSAHFLPRFPTSLSFQLECLSQTKHSNTATYGIYWNKLCRLQIKIQSRKHHCAPSNYKQQYCTYSTKVNLRLHSKAGGGLNMCHSGLGQTSQFVGMWYEICTNSWPLSPIVPGLSSRRVDNSNCDRLPSSGLLASPSPAYRSCKISQGTY